MSRIFSLLMLLTVSAAVCPAATEPVAVCPLGHGLQGRLDADGAVRIEVVTDDGPLPLLSAAWTAAAAGRAAERPAFTATAREGDPDGRRGFSRRADDDDDGRIDEDPLDGVDNDGDGLIDEDFAAVSHLMGVWSRRAGDRRRHLETYHWTYQHLAGLMVAVFDQQGDAVAANVRLSLAGHGAWTPADEACSPAFFPEGSALPFLAVMDDPRPGGRPLWLGAILLDSEPRRRSDHRVRLERQDLVVPPLGGRLALAIAAGPTRLQVLEDLKAAIRLQEGVVDPVTGRRVRWLPPVQRQELPADRLPEALLRPEANDRFSLVFRVSDEQERFWDPDLFRLEGRALGTAEALAWTDDEGRREELAWSAVGGAGEACQPYATLGAAGPGILEIRFRGPIPGAGERLELVHVDGRRGACDLVVPAVDPREPAGTDQASGDPVRRLQLSPALLVSSPNPFHQATRITFTVPETVGEAFAQEEGREVFADPRQRMPYADGAASVQVTVYGLEGRDLATLHAGQAGVGVYETSWDGRDREGRALASGTYVCRLQIDQWSVTRRLIFIR